MVDLYSRQSQGTLVIFLIVCIIISDSRKNLNTYEDEKLLCVHYFAKKSLSWYAPNIRP